jgi:hypothetical protein
MSRLVKEVRREARGERECVCKTMARGDAKQERRPCYTSLIPADYDEPPSKKQNMSAP